MKKLYYFTFMAAAMAFTGCSDDMSFNSEGEGAVVISTCYNSDVKVASRSSLEEELSESTIVWISSPKGLVRKFNGLGSLPVDGIKLVAGDYIAEAWAGDSVPASFESRYFKGRQEFSVSNGVTRVELLCKIANVVAAVDYDANIDNVLSDYSLTIGHARGELTFQGRDQRRGYFMMPTGIEDLTWTLTGKQADGSEFTKSGVIPNVEPATLYTVNVKFTSSGVSGDEIGAGFITIEIDDTTIDINDQITVTAAPTITGYGYDLSEPVSAEPGNVGRRSIYVTAASALTGMIVSSDDLIGAIGSTEIDLLRADQSVLSMLEASGITYQYAYNAEYDISNLKVSFEESFTNSLEAGEHEFTFTATDANDKSSQATLVFNITDADVEAADIPVGSPAVWATKARLTGKYLKDNVSNPGFQYRESGQQGWITVPATMLSRSGEEFFADIEDLTPGTEYQYRAVSDGFEPTAFKTFSTEKPLQLPNAGFEEWGKSTRSKTPVIPALNDDQLFWDSGNHGSATMGVSLTNETTDYFVEGSKAAKLRSQFVGLGGFAGKFAAGNIFVGQYLYTSGTDGELGWGRGFTSRPKSLKLYARYEPGTVQSGNNKGSGEHMKVGDLDQGIIYLALMDDYTNKYNQSKSDCNGTNWPCIVKTKASERQLFDPSRSNEHIVGYAAIIFDKATEGNGLVEVSVDIDYYRTDVIPSNIIFVASASRYGDYFEGGEGSTLYLDDIQLIY